MYLHDWCQPIIDNLKPMVSMHETLASCILPCETELWEATDAMVWVRILETPSPYGSLRSRLDGLHLKDTVRFVESDAPLPELAQFPPRMTLHFTFNFILGSFCAQDHTRWCDRSLDRIEATFTRWFSIWAMAMAHFPAAGFFQDTLPFYLVGKAMVYCARKGYTLDTDPDTRFNLVIEWFRHFRGWLDEHEEITPEIWETLPVEALLSPEISTANVAVTSPSTLQSYMQESSHLDLRIDSLMPVFMTFKLDD